MVRTTGRSILGNSEHLHHSLHKINYLDAKIVKNSFEIGTVFYRLQCILLNS